MENANLEEVIEKAKALPPEEQQQFTELLGQFGDFMFDEDVWSLLEVIQSFKSEAPQALPRYLTEEPSLEELIETVRRLLTVWPPSERESLAKSIKGKYAHIQTSSERFAQLKQEEIKLEDSRR